MKRILVTSLFILAILAFAAAQRPSTAPAPSASQPPSSQAPSSSQPSSPSSQAPSSSQTQPTRPDSTGQGSSTTSATKATVTEGCLGSTESAPTLTDKANITYKLNLPPNFDASMLSSHAAESVQIIGDVTDPGNTGNPSIDVQSVRTGTGTCPAGGARSTPQ